MTVHANGRGRNDGTARLAGAAYLAIIGYSLLSLIFLAPHIATADAIAVDDVWFRVALAGDAVMYAGASATVVVMVPLCLGTIVFCWLFWMSRSIPRPLAGFGIAAFAFMLPCAVGSLLAPALVQPAFLAGGAVTILFEIAIGAWLLVRGVEMAEEPA